MSKPLRADNILEESQASNAKNHLNEEKTPKYNKIPLL